MIQSLLLITPLLLLAWAAPEPPTCTDGGTLYCCQSTLAGDLPLIETLANVSCYNLTPEDVNCIGTDAPIDPDTGCVGTYTCCQVTRLAPVVGLFCSKPPGDCEGGPENCTNILDKFGDC
ncbi:hypothetical protein EV356DRAFT_502001 [Viridothelium virens]|uniref:Hydrophobin n=1 Tax=Viridothelium virens TaxID=1048519 RepID=A0A6A6HLQ1_VIRVR|nr:hypothetical protein EV356DRAFT_502001 [Viridothelium virens]